MCSTVFISVQLLPSDTLHTNEHGVKVTLEVKMKTLLQILSLLLTRSSFLVSSGITCIKIYLYIEQISVLIVLMIIFVCLQAANGQPNMTELETFLPRDGSNAKDGVHAK